MPYGAKLDVVKEEVRVVPVGQGGSQGGPSGHGGSQGGSDQPTDPRAGLT